MNRLDFQNLADIRISEAKVLLEAKCWPGAFYVCGYAVECALKACIAKLTKQYDFPEKGLVNQIFTHNPEKLLGAAGLKADLNKESKSDKDLEKNWAQVLNWSEDSRYNSSITEDEARNLFAAVTDPKSGVLEWLKKRW